MDLTTLDYHAVPDSSLAAVLVHPHPDMGGDRFNAVIDAVYRSLPPAGVSAARFDVSSSDPLQARVDTLTVISAIVAPQVVLVGYSFGADVILSIDDTRVVGWFAVAPPLRLGDFAAVGPDARPKYLLVPERDQFSPPPRVRELTAGWTHTTVVSLADADHFLNGQATAVADGVRAWIGRLPSDADPT